MLPITSATSVLSLKVLVSYGHFFLESGSACARKSKMFSFILVLGTSGI